MIASVLEEAAYLLAAAPAIIRVRPRFPRAVRSPSAENMRRNRRASSRRGAWLRRLRTAPRGMAALLYRFLSFSSHSGACGG